MMNFQEKSVLITGGSRGIGKAIALAFAESGAQVAINFVNDNEEASKTIRQMPHSERHIAIKADIGVPSSAQQLVQSVVKEFGKLDILINNAGVIFIIRLTNALMNNGKMLGVKLCKSIYSV